ncbi:MAG: DNA polymerase III subunit gamma/tau [Bacteroidales bacterium]|nr:DNA polymerase III subunit gamma/tau [Bacteroidales bacterium]
MADYIVSARKYRPDSFESLIGQDNIVQTLKNSITRGQLAHAYLFCGPRGVGKTSAARIFAKTINCANPTADMEPCCQCESCVSFQEGRSYCIHELDAASNNSVDDIKALIDQVNIPPQIGRYSVYIVDEVHMLSQSAFNAFLKTLEEPPAHAIFILATTEKHKILPTILSRCQTYDFNRISIPDIVQNLKGIAGKENIKIDDESLHVIAMKADGAMRDALTIFDQTVAFCGTDVRYEDVIRNLNVLDYDHCFKLVDSFLAGDYAAALLKFNEILSKGFNALHFVSSLSSHLRDLIVARSGGLDSLLELPESLKERYREQAARSPMQFLYDALSITTACETGYKASVNPRLHIEFALMKLSFLCGVGEVSLRPAAAPARPAAAPAMPAEAAEKAIKPEPVKAEEPVAKPAEEPKPAEKPQPAEEPKPAKEEKPSEEPKPTRRRSVKVPAAGLSINAIKEAEQNGKLSADEDNKETDRMPEEEALLTAFKGLAKDYGDRPRLATMIENAETEVSEDNGTRVLSFFVQNVAQQDWIKDKMLTDLENKLRLKLNSSRLRMEVLVTPDKEVKHINYTPQEQARELMAGNPEITNLVKDMGLDV